jgi:uncharacterized damage-inducible protein DinB
MFTDIDPFLRYFEGAHRRSVRDISALPPEAAAWKPKAGEGENTWDVAALVAHMAGARLYFSRAYRNEGWIFDGPVSEIRSQDDWVPCLEDSMAEFRRRLEGTPADWLNRRIQMIDTDGTLAGWRILMMCLEHEVHHRSQIETYAGIEGWPVMDIYGRSAEQIGAQRDRQRELHDR